MAHLNENRNGFSKLPELSETVGKDDRVILDEPSTSKTAIDFYNKIDSDNNIATGSPHKYKDKVNWSGNKSRNRDHSNDSRSSSQAVNRRKDIHKRPTKGGGGANKWGHPTFITVIRQEVLDLPIALI